MEICQINNLSMRVTACCARENVQIEQSALMWISDADQIIDLQYVDYFDEITVAFMW